MVLELRRAVVLKTSVFKDKTILNTKLKLKGPKNNNLFQKMGKNNIDMAANSVKLKVVK